MDQIKDILYLLAFFALAGVTGVVFYIFGQLLDRSGYRKKTQALINSVNSQRRLANELRHEASVHRKLTGKYRAALGEREDYWIAVEKRWIAEAKRAKNVISQQEEIRKKHAISLKEANRSLIAMENDFQQNKRDNETRINALKSAQQEPERIKQLEAESAEQNETFSKEIEAKKSKVAELQLRLQKRDDKLGKLENIILKKNNDLNDLKIRLKQSAILEGKFSAVSDSLREKSSAYEAIKQDLKNRNESLAKLQRALHAAQTKMAQVGEESSASGDLEEIKKTLFIKETQLLEKESAMKKLAVDLDQKQHLVSQLQTDINARNQKLSALTVQLEDSSALDEALAKIDQLNLDAKRRNQQVTSLRDQLEETELVLEQHRGLLTEFKTREGSKDVSIQNLTTELSKKETQILSLQAQIKEAEGLLVKKDGDLNTLSNKLNDTHKLDQLRAQLRSKETELQDLAKESQFGKQGIASLEGQLAEREKKIGELATQLKDTAEIDVLSNKLVLFQSQVAEKDASLAKAQKVISDEKFKVQKLVEDARKPVTELSALRNLLAKKEQELEKLDQRNAQNESAIEVLHQQAEECGVDLNTKAEVIKDLQAQLQDRSENQKLQKQLDALKATNDHQQTQIAEQHTLVDEKKKMLGALEHQIGEKDALLEKLAHENNGLKALNQEDEIRLQELNDELKDTSAIDALRKKLSEVDDILGTKQTQLNESHEANVAKQKRIDELEHYLGEKEAAVRHLNDQIKDLEQGVFKRSQQIDVLHKQLQDHSEVDNVKQQLGIFQSNLSSKESELSSVSNTLKQKEGRVVELEVVVADRDDQIASLVRVEEELSEKKQTYDLLHNDFLAHQNKLKELEVANAGKQQRIQELEGFLRETHDELKQEREKLENTSELDLLKAELSKQKEAYDISQSKYVVTHQELEKKQKQLDESYHEVLRLRGELEDTSALDNLKNELVSQESLLREREVAVTALKTQINDQGKELHTFKASVADPKEIAALQSSLSQKEASIGSLQGEKSRLSEKNEIIERQLLESHLEVERLRRQLADTSQSDTLNKDIQHKQERIDLLLKENESKHQRLLELEKSIIHKADEISTLQQLIANTSEVDRLNEEIELKTIEMNARKQEAEVAQARSEELERQRVQHRAEIASLNTELKSSLDKLADTRQVDDLQKQLDYKVGFIHNLNAETSEKQGKIAALELALVEKEATLDRLQLQLNDTSEADSIREALNHKTVELNKLTNLMEKKEAILNDLEAALNNAKSELLTIKSTLSDTSEVDGLRQQLVEKNKQIDELHSETVSHQDELVALKTGLQQKQTELERSIEKANDSSELDQLREKLEEKEGRVKFLDDKAQMTSSRLEELEHRVASRDKELVKLQAQVADTSKLDKVIAALDEKESQVSHLKAESAQREGQISKLETQLKELDSTLEAKQDEVLQLQDQVSDLTRQSMLASFGSSDIEQHPDKGIIYTKEPNEKDNLGDIFGVSDDLQQQLNKIGIYRLKQIALWGETQIKYFQEELDFDGNIEREQWPLQAQRLIG